VQDLTRRLLAVRDELGIAILLVEQSAAAALTIADHAYVMENGRIVLDGDRERLKSHQDVQEFYLGQARRRAPLVPGRQAISPVAEVVWLSSTSLI
jgi:branched-chain amino acid transport system ATP-binding protein